MLKKSLMTLSLAAVTLSLLVPVYAAAPAKIAAVAPVSDLVADAEVRIKALEEALATNESYLGAKVTAIPRDAGVLAVLSQAIVESEEKAAWKASAPDLRDAAISIWSAKSYDEAKKGLEAAKAAHGGAAGGAKPDHPWNQLIKLGALMKEIGARNTKLRRVVKAKQFPPDPSEAARDASVLAVLGLAAHDDTHEVKKPEEVGEYQKWAKDFQVQMTELSAALKKKDQAGADGVFKKAQSVCSDCHAKFRPDVK